MAIYTVSCGIDVVSADVTVHVFDFHWSDATNNMADVRGVTDKVNNGDFLLDTTKAEMIAEA
jgi:hypothetical protein